MDKTFDWAVIMGSPIAGPGRGNLAAGVDEVQWQRGHQFLTVVYQIDKGCRRWLWVGRDRTVETMLRFFRQFRQQQAESDHQKIFRLQNLPRYGNRSLSCSWRPT